MNARVNENDVSDITSQLRASSARQCPTCLIMRPNHYCSRQARGDDSYLAAVLDELDGSISGILSTTNSIGFMYPHVISIPRREKMYSPDLSPLIDLIWFV